MPPPTPSADTPLLQRFLALAQTLQYAWFVGHVTLLLCTVRYGLSYVTFNYYSSWAKFSYRTAFVAAAATYGIVVFKAYRARARAGKAGQQGLIQMAMEENVQYLGMALIWLFSKQVPMAILPFAVYSLFHVATYIRANLLPVLSPPAAGSPAGAKTASVGLSDSIVRFVKEYYDSSMALVAVLEITLWFRLLFSAVLFQKGSWVLLVVYTAFFRVRHAQSGFVQSAVAQGVGRADALFANQGTPPAVRGVWEQVKGAVRRGADATDVNRLTRPQAAPKKAQ